MTDRIFHCDVCDCDVSKKCQIKHLKSKKHFANLHGKDHVEIDDGKRKCCQCSSTKSLDFFRNDNKTCNKCLEYCKNYKKNNPEKTAESKKAYFQKIKDEVYTCPVCQIEMKKYKRTQHEKGIGHKYLVELKERGEEMEKPDKITIDKDGNEWYDCFACNGSMLKNSWGAHLVGWHHLKCKKCARVTEEYPTPLAG